ncbi:MAG TPA: LPS assembly protein LptD [Steroidobacteraceae bacterium]|nr:LPS assembly protein LptD [Steroidobacteraceae bacterium]
MPVLTRRVLTSVVCALVCGPLLSPARADSPFSCPAPQTAGRQKTAPIHEPSFAAGGILNLSMDKAIWGLDGNGTLSGHVVVRQGQRVVQSDDADYQSAANAVRVKGKVDYEDPLLHLTGSDGWYSSTGGASFNDAQFELLQRDAHGAAKLVDLTPGGILRLQEVTFSTCPVTEEIWQVRAGSLTLDSGEHAGVARDARVDFDGIPILYLPWLSFPLDDERKTGFLFPSVGTNSRSGLELSTPWYWNIAPNEDLLLTPTYYTRRGVDLGGDARYMTDTQHGELVWHFLPYDAQAAGEGLRDHDRSYVHLTQTTELPDDLRLHIDAANVGDALYFQDFGQGPEGTSVAYLQRSAAVSYRDENWRLSAQFQQYQTLDAIEQLLDPTQRPYARLPQIVADGDFVAGPAGILHYGFDSELVNFDRDIGVTGWRLDLRPGAVLHVEGPGYFLRPGVAFDYTRYSLDNVASGQDRNPGRSLPTASVDTGLLFERPAGRDGGRTLTLEPRALYVYTPYRDQDQLPIFDTALPDLNLVELFRTNRYVGIDRIGDANQVSAAVTSRLLDTGSGRQFLSATLGQTYYFEPPKVQIPLEPLTGLRSDLIAEVALTAYRNWTVNLGEQWDPQTHKSDRTIVELQYKPDSEAVVNLAYRFQRDNPAEQQAEAQAVSVAYGEIYASEIAQGLTPTQAQLRATALTQAYLTSSSLDQIEASVAWPVLRNWNAFGRVVYALDQHQMLERFAGFEYHGCCWGLRILARRSLSNSTGRQDTGIFVQLELNGLASVGSEAGTFLGSAIRGYSPPSVSP